MTPSDLTPSDLTPHETTPQQVIRVLRELGHTLATAESLTGGLVAATLTDVPGASDVLRGGVVAYHSEVKASLLGVDRHLLATHGAVHPRVAEQMALGVRALLGTTWGISTTGVAGPTPSDGQPVGTVYFALVGPDRAEVRCLHADGGRVAVRAATVESCLAGILQLITPA